MQKKEMLLSTDLTRCIDNYIAKCKRNELNQDLKRFKDADLETLCEIFGNPLSARIIHHNLHNCKEGMMTIFEVVSDTVLCEGWTYMFKEGAMLCVCSPTQEFKTIRIDSIDWKKGTFMTCGQEYRFILETTKEWRARKRAEAASSISQPCKAKTTS